MSKIAGKNIDILFVPHVIPTKRGIISTVYMKQKKKVTQAEIDKIYRDFYKGEPFVRFLGSGAVPELKDVVFSNFCDIGAKQVSDIIVAVSAIDNLTKGAATPGRPI